MRRTSRQVVTFLVAALALWGCERYEADDSEHSDSGRSGPSVAEVSVGGDDVYYQSFDAEGNRHATDRFDDLPQVRRGVVGLHDARRMSGESSGKQVFWAGLLGVEKGEEVRARRVSFDKFRRLSIASARSARLALATAGRARELSETESPPSFGGRETDDVTSLEDYPDWATGKSDNRDRNANEKSCHRGTPDRHPGVPDDLPNPDWGRDEPFRLDVDECEAGTWLTHLPMGSAWVAVEPGEETCRVWLGGESENPLDDGGPTQFCEFLRRPRCSVRVKFSNGGPARIESPGCTSAPRFQREKGESSVFSKP